MSRELLKGMNEAFVVRTALYGSQAWVLNAGSMSRVADDEMGCQSSMS